MIKIKLTTVYRFQQLPRDICASTEGWLTYKKTVTMDMCDAVAERLKVRPQKLSDTIDHVLGPYVDKLSKYYTAYAVRPISDDGTHIAFVINAEPSLYPQEQDKHHAMFSHYCNYLSLAAEIVNTTIEKAQRVSQDENTEGM